MQPVTPPQVPAATTPSGPVAYGFADAHLGQSLADWRATRRERAAAGCVGLATLTSIEICRDRDVDLGGGYSARDLTLVFVDGRLAKIAFKASIDAFDAVTASLRRAFGDPQSIERDTIKRTGFPHVSIIWRNGRSTIRLSDPLEDASQLGITFELDALAGRIPLMAMAPTTDAQRRPIPR